MKIYNDLYNDVYKKLYTVMEPVNKRIAQITGYPPED
jgi:hypothetical protein